MARTLYATAAIALLAGQTYAQAGPNTLSQYDPNQMTQSVNTTYNVIPVNSTLVASIVAPKKLVPIANDPSKYPNGWPEGYHPVLVSGGYNANIKQLGLAIPAYLMSGRIEIPCVDQLNDGTTCFRAQPINYIGSVNGQQFNPAIVPALVGSVEGNTILPGSFNPDNAALNDLGNGQYSFEADALLVGNPISGPAVGPEAFQFTLSKVDESPLLTAEGFHFFISQPVIANNGVECVNAETFFNASFAQPFFCESQVTIYSYALEANGVPTDLAGDYNATCYSANGEMVGYPQESCAQAQASLDPTAEQ